MTSLLLPFPPTVNGLFDGKKRRFKSKRYKAWLEEANADLEFQKYHDGSAWQNHAGQVRITLLLKAKDKRARDLDNLAKAVIDLLVSNKVIVDDDSRYLRSLYMEWKDDMPVGCFVMVEDV